MGIKPLSSQVWSGFFVSLGNMFMLKQNAETVNKVTIIMAKPNINPILKVSIFLIQAIGEKKHKTMRPKYSGFRSYMSKSDSVVDLRP